MRASNDSSNILLHSCVGFWCVCYFFFCRWIFLGKNDIYTYKFLKIGNPQKLWQKAYEIAYIVVGTREADRENVSNLVSWLVLHTYSSVRVLSVEHHFLSVTTILLYFSFLQYFIINNTHYDGAVIYMKRNHHASQYLMATFWYIKAIWVTGYFFFSSFICLNWVYSEVTLSSSCFVTGSFLSTSN
jgi:hypothetical protein